MTLRILLADDHDIFRRGLRLMLEEHEHWEVCGEAANGVQALRLVEKLRPHVVLLDLNMPVMNGLEALDRIHARFPELPVVVLTMHGSRTIARETEERGASGFVTKMEAPAELARVIEHVAGKT